MTFGMAQFLVATPKTQCMKEIMDKLDFPEIKNFYTAKDIVKRISR